jgi:stage V sporulation protein S
MNRFFSKLDLRDIKIDPAGSHFPPDEASYRADADTETMDTSAPDVEPVDPEPVWHPELPLPVSANGHVPPAPLDDEADPEAALGRGGDVLKVSARSRPSAVAGAIAGVVRENGRAEIQAIGAGATNQAVKAVAIAREYLRDTGIDAICVPAFIDVTIDNEDRTAIRLVVEPR